MGYLSNLAVAIDLADRQDDSYPSAEQQLLQRLEDLRGRMEELIQSDPPLAKRLIIKEDAHRIVKRVRYICYSKTCKQAECDGQTGYTAHILDCIIDKVVQRHRFLG